MSLIEKTTHAAEARDHLLEQFKKKERIRAVLDAFSVQIQDLERVFFDLLENRWIDTATGAQLDGLGAIVGEPRQGRNDEDYRLAIRARVLINKSSGTVPELLAILSLLLPGGAFQLIEYFPAAFVVELLNSLDLVIISGAHTGANDASILTDSSQAWGVDALVGKVIQNITDDSIGVVSANTATTVTSTLNGGSENLWDTGDQFVIYDTPREIFKAVHAAKAAGVGFNLIWFQNEEDVFIWDVEDHGFDEGRWAGALS